MRIGDRVFVSGYIDEIRKDAVIVRNDGGYFGTIPSEVMGELPSAQQDVTDTNVGKKTCKTCHLWEGANCMREANLQTDTKGPEPCDDAVSRKMAMDAITASTPYCVVPDDYHISVVDMEFRISTSPSVAPKQKRGKWIYGEDEYGIDGYHCDKCGFFVPWDYTHTFINYIDDYNFCPNCGADMRGERDGKIHH